MDMGIATSNSSPSSYPGCVLTCIVPVMFLVITIIISSSSSSSNETTPSHPHPYPHPQWICVSPNPTRPNPTAFLFHFESNMTSSRKQTDRSSRRHASERATSASLLPLRDFLRSFPRPVPSRPVPSCPGDGMPCTHILYTSSPLGGRVSCVVEATETGRRAVCGRDIGACRSGFWLWLWFGCMYVSS
jgi:hypothetical protein